MYILQQKSQRRLEILSERLSNTEMAIEETSNPDASLVATKDRIESQMEKVQLTWGQRLNMAESGVEYEIMALGKLTRKKQALEKTKTPAEEIEVPEPMASVKGGRWINGLQ